MSVFFVIRCPRPIVSTAPLLHSSEWDGKSKPEIVAMEGAGKIENGRVSLHVSPPIYDTLQGQGLECLLKLYQTETVNEKDYLAVIKAGQRLKWKSMHSVVVPK